MVEVASMRNGIHSGPLQASLPGAAIFNSVCAEQPTFSPLVAYAIKVNETGDDLSPNVESGDGGKGWMQLTSSYPDNWDVPEANVRYAVREFLIPAETFWAAEGLEGDDLVRAIAAEYNAGRGGAEAGHEQGDIGKFTTDHYSDRCLQHYQLLEAGLSPF